MRPQVRAQEKLHAARQVREYQERVKRKQEILEDELKVRRGAAPSFSPACAPPPHRQLTARGHPSGRMGARP